MSKALRKFLVVCHEEINSDRSPYSTIIKAANEERAQEKVEAMHCKAMHTITEVE